ncbi:MAG: serine/threonine protein phosphatase [Hyphomicrobiales bacterium]|nr:serine/threonine protein phosphatase [Hyphomicrobiales bacterium]
MRFLRSRAKRRWPTLPEGWRIYAIGDVHGRVDLLDEIFARIDENLARSSAHRAVHVLLGDYVDRGPSSREVLDRLVKRRRSHHVICLKGNHESYLIDFLHNPSVLSDWRHFGGLETLRSYGLDPSANPNPREELKLARAFGAALPEAHKDVLRKLGASFTCGDFFFAHAGVKPGVPLAQQSENDLLWIRDDFLLSEQDFGKVVVHGHTPVLAPDIRPNRINIDTGAYATGRLTCLMIEKDTLFVL